MSLARVQSSRQKATEDPNKENFKSLVEEEVSYFASQKPRVESSSIDLKAAQSRNSAAQARIDELKRRIAETRAKRPETVQAIRSLEDLQEYSATYEGLLKEFTTRRQILTHVLSYSAADFKQADLALVSRWLDTWGPFFTEAEAACKLLKRRERHTPNASAYVPPTKALYDVLDEVCRLQLQARSLVGRERYRRSAFSTESVEDFMDNQQQLRDWCSKQHETLDGLKSLGDLEEFSTSFHANVPVMDSNFLVLAEQSELLATNRETQQAMRTVNGAWIELCLATYERLREAARKAHAESGVETLCSEWATETVPRVERLVRRIVALLKNPGDDVADAPDAKRVLKRCEKVLAEQDSFQIVCAHLADFTVREECVAPHFDALRNELQSEMTSTVLSLPCAAEYDGRLEYKNRIEELREWIDVKSQKGTYVKLLERLEDTKQMIEEYADALFPEEDGGNCTTAANA